MNAINHRDPSVKAALAELQPLASVIAETLHTVPVRIGPGGDQDLVAELTLAIAIYCARHVLPAGKPPAQDEQPATPGTLTEEQRTRLNAFLDGPATARVLSALHHSAEQDVTRVIDLYERWVKAGPPPLGASMARWWDARLVELHNAIRPTDDQSKGE